MIYDIEVMNFFEEMVNDNFFFYGKFLWERMVMGEIKNKDNFI